MVRHSTETRESRWFMLSAIEPEAARANTQRAGLGRFDPLGRLSPNDRNLRI
jgi:hypothetical protein